MDTYPLQQGDRRTEFIEGRGVSNAILCQPQRTNEPGIALRLRKVMGDLIIVIVLVAWHSTDRSLYPQRLFKHVHRLLDMWIMRGEHTKQEEPAQAAVQCGIFLNRAVWSHRDHA